MTRAKDGFSFNIDGETIELPSFESGEPGGVHWISDGEDYEKKLSGTMILSQKPIDDATQQAIRSLLESAGYAGEVDFVDHADAGRGKVMIKKVERVVEKPKT